MLKKKFNMIFKGIKVMKNIKNKINFKQFLKTKKF